MIAGWVFGVSVLANCFCAAVNLYTWRLAYPLWAFAGADFEAVHREYLRRLTPVITVPHVVMFFAGLASALRPVPKAPLWESWAVFGLDTAVIAASVGLAGPVHTRFATQGLDEAGLRRLIGVSAWRSGWMLTACGLLIWQVATLVAAR